MQLLMSTAALMVALNGQDIATDEDYESHVVTDRPDALYSAGDTAEFDITIERKGVPVTDGSVLVVLTDDGSEEVFRGYVDITGPTTTVTRVRSTPGFLRCWAVYKLPSGNYANAWAAAGFDPEQIQPSLPPPDDFDEFWADQIAQLDEVPMNAQLVPVDSGNDSIELFDVTLDCLGGKPVRGYFARPAGAISNSLPALLSMHGAGVYSANKDWCLLRASEGILAMDINAHGIENGMPASYYSDLAAGELSGYPYFGMESRDTIYFRGMYLRLYRAMEFLQDQSQWDHKTLGAWGSSQGGAQTLAAAGLNSNVNVFVASVPALCNNNGMINGWPRFWRPERGEIPSTNVYEAVRYYDSINFAARTDARALLAVGFIDDTCRPTTVYGAYNSLRGQKEIMNFPLMGHEWRAEIFDHFMEQFREVAGMTNNELLVYDGFDYAAGQDLSTNTVGGTGWAVVYCGGYNPGYQAAWNSYPTTITVTNGSLTGPSGFPASVGNSVMLGGSVGDASRLVSNDNSSPVDMSQDGAVFYFSYLFRASGMDTVGSDFAGVRFNSMAGGYLYVYETGNGAALGAYSGNGGNLTYSSGSYLQNGITYLVVGKCSNSGGNVSMSGSVFVDGDTLAEPATWMVTDTDPYSAQSYSQVEFIGKPNNTMGAQFDEFRMGTTFESVVPQ